MTEDKSSMLYWYPRIKDLPIPQPKTEMIDIRECGHEWYYDWIDGKAGPPEALIVKLRKAYRQMGYPVFLRTDHISGKHDWSDTCFVENEERLGRCVFGLVEASMMADLPINAFAVREYIPMDTLFVAFRNHMPVNPEIRFFVRAGVVECRHWYWIEDAICNASESNWQERLAARKELIGARELGTLYEYAKMVASEFKGYWSIDFCRAADGRWILIDMAEGDKSWHPEDCECNRGRPRYSGRLPRMWVTEGEGEKINRKLR